MEIEINCRKITLRGDLTVPDNASGTVIFVHGSGSSRHSPRNKSVARYLNDAGFATLLFDLLTENEEIDRDNVFDIELLAQRLIEVTKWISSHEKLSKFPIGYFGASTGAAAALVAVTLLGNEVSAIVSRGGRVDLAGDYLEKVVTPTLMLIGDEDREVLALNYQAQKRLGGINEIEVVPGATHLFEEPGALEVVARSASRWFLRYF